MAIKDKNMSRALDRLTKLAAIFEKKLKKNADTPVVIQGDNDLVVWLNTNFGPSAKNSIASNIANAIEDDMNSLYVTLSVSGGKLNIETKLNGAPSEVARKIVNDAVLPKISPNLSKFPNGAKYQGWIKYPK